MRACFARRAAAPSSLSLVLHGCRSAHLFRRRLASAPPLMAANAQGYAHDRWARADGGSGGGDDDDARRVSPSAERNKQPILEALAPRLPQPLQQQEQQQNELVLEVASGTGQHAAHLAAALRHLDFQPSDLTSELFPSIEAYTRRLPNVRLPPLLLDASAPPGEWPAQLPPGGCCAVLACNLTHISPWPVTLGLLAGAARLLRPGGRLLLYGPFKVGGAFTSDSNRQFHESLVQQDARWGYRDVADIAAAAAAVAAAGGEAARATSGGGGLALVEQVEMPANNLLLVFEKKSS